MKKICTVLVFLFASFFSKILFAQDPCGCNIALERNTQDEFQSTNSSSFRQVLGIIFSNSFEYWEEGTWKNNQDISSGGSYGVYSGFFNASQSREERRSKFQEMKSYYELHNDISQSAYKSYSQKVASGKVYDSWRDCKRLCGEWDGMLLNKTVSGNEIIVTLEWKHRNPTDQQRILSIVTSNATQLQGGNLGRDTIVRGQNSYSGRFSRIIPTQDVSIKVNVSDYSTDPVIVPGIEIENPGSNYPVGTIIASVLEWRRFCRINNQPEVLDYTNKTKCKWAPADGRSVVGSTYGTIENNVPDLRGVFIRGLNDFQVPGVQGVDPQQTDPDPDVLGRVRVANSLQNDAFKKHDHGYRLPGGATNAAGGNVRTEITASSEQRTSREGVSDNETRPTNKAVYYYIKIN